MGEYMCSHHDHLTQYSHDSKTRDHFPIELSTSPFAEDAQAAWTTSKVRSAQVVDSYQYTHHVGIPVRSADLVFAGKTIDVLFVRE